MELKSRVNCQFLNASIEAVHAVSNALVPGRSLVDIVPIRACMRTVTVSDKHPMTPLKVRCIPEVKFEVLAKELAHDKFKTSVNGLFEYVKSATEIHPQAAPNLATL